MKIMPNKYSVLSDEFLALASSNPDLKRFRRTLVKCYLLLVIFSMLLAAVLPSGSIENLRLMGWWADFVKNRIPYVGWAVRNSPIPVLVGFWLSIVWPLMFGACLYLLCKMPYKVIGGIFILHPVKINVRLKILFICLLFLFLIYNLFVERNFATSAHDVVGHARIFEAQFLSSRWGMFFIAPWIVTLCFATFFGATAGIIGITLTFFLNSREVA
ncbi:hypothetical protein [Paracidovorax avenae]|uniref:hypothetical protein n=2 Tax=Paracidovorax avenae TaxID=80867 RepID=UPI001F39924A|nr:hypothetical protein [Paracidovorax avenae]